MFHVVHRLMVVPSVMLSTWLPIFHIPHNTCAICSLYNFGKYNFCHRPDKAILFVISKAFHDWKYFCFTELLRTLPPVGTVSIFTRRKLDGIEPSSANRVLVTAGILNMWFLIQGRIIGAGRFPET